MSHIVELSKSKVSNLECLKKAVEHIKGVKLTFDQKVESGILASAKAAVTVNCAYPGTISSVSDKFTRQDHVHMNLKLEKGSEMKIVRAKLEGNTITFQGDSDYRANIDRVFGKGCTKLIDYYNREVAMQTTQQVYGDQVVSLEETEVAGKIGLTAILA